MLAKYAYKGLFQPRSPSVVRAATPQPPPPLSAASEDAKTVVAKPSSAPSSLATTPTGVPATAVPAPTTETLQALGIALGKALKPLYTSFTKNQFVSFKFYDETVKAEMPPALITSLSDPTLNHLQSYLKKLFNCMNQHVSLPTGKDDKENARAANQAHPGVDEVIKKLAVALPTADIKRKLLAVIVTLNDLFIAASTINNELFRSGKDKKEFDGWKIGAQRLYVASKLENIDKQKDLIVGTLNTLQATLEVLKPSELMLRLHVAELEKTRESFVQKFGDFVKELIPVREFAPPNTASVTVASPANSY